MCQLADYVENALRVCGIGLAVDNFDNSERFEGERMTKRSPLGVRLLGNIVIFVVSGTILFVITELVAYFHGRQHLQSLSAAAGTAPVKMKPGQLASRFWSIQNVPSECNTLPPYYFLLW